MLIATSKTLIDTSIGRSLVASYCAIYEPHLVRQRKAHCFRRKRFYAAGAFDVVCVDQHDKWKKFGLALHTGVEPFIGELEWIRVWWTNNNPRLIASYYLDWVEETGCELIVFQEETYSKFSSFKICHS